MALLVSVMHIIYIYSRNLSANPPKHEEVGVYLAKIITFWFTWTMYGSVLSEFWFKTR